MISAFHASELLRTTLIRDASYTGYTHDIAAAVLQDAGLGDRIYIIADERGAGEYTFRWEWRDAYTVIEQLAEYGGEALIYHPDHERGRCGIEFRRTPDSIGRMQSTLETVRRMLDTNPDANEGR